MIVAQPTGAELFDLSATQWGKKYRMGAEVRHDLWSLQRATAWDCSEIVEVVHAVRGVYLPDGSSAQGDYLKKYRIPLERAAHIKGAVAGHYPKGGKPGHVVFLEGDGVHTSEAMGRAYGVLRGKLAGRGLTWAALVPGVSYTDRPAVVPAPPAATPPPPGSLAALAQAAFYARQFRLGVPGVELNPDAVKFAQAGLNHFFDNFAKLTSQPNPPDYPLTGKWDKWTRDAVILMQQLTKINELGTLGPRSWGALYP